MRFGNETFFSYSLPYIFGILYLGFTEMKWMTDEFTIQVEGHEVAKVMLVVFFFYLHAFIYLGLEMATFASTILLMPFRVRNLQNSLLEKINIIVAFHMQSKMAAFKFLTTLIFSVGITKLSIVLWKYVLLWHVCSSHNFRCQFSHAGRLATSLKQKVCGVDPKSIMCKIMMDHIALVWFALFIMLLGYILLPCINIALRKFKTKKSEETQTNNSEIEENCATNDKSNADALGRLES